jgi:hypothetical protein
MQVSYALDRCLSFWCLTNKGESQGEELQGKQQQQQQQQQQQHKWAKSKAYCGSMPCLGGFPYHASVSPLGKCSCSMRALQNAAAALFGAAALFFWCSACGMCLLRIGFHVSVFASSCTLTAAATRCPAPCHRVRRLQREGVADGPPEIRVQKPEPVEEHSKQGSPPLHVLSCAPAI